MCGVVVASAPYEPIQVGPHLLYERRSFEFGLRPGVFTFAIAGCEMEQHAVLRNVPVRGPLYIDIGPLAPPTPPPAGYGIVRTQLIINIAPPGQCLGPGAHVANPGECCSREMDGVTNRCR